MGSLYGARPFRSTAVGTNGGATITVSAPDTGLSNYPTNIQCSGDAAALVTVESPASTVLYRKRFAAAFNMSETFQPRVFGTTAALVVKVSASTSNSEANVQGFTETL